MGTLLSSLMHVCVFVNYIWQSILTEIITVMMYKHEIWISCWNYITEKIELCSQTLSPPACFYAECVLYSKKREREHTWIWLIVFFFIGQKPRSVAARIGCSFTLWPWSGQVEEGNPVFISDPLLAKVPLGPTALHSVAIALHPSVADVAWPHTQELFCLTGIMDTKLVH